MKPPRHGQIVCGDALQVLESWPDKFVQCVVTSPPYWGLRDYGVDGQLGLETTPDEYVAKLVEIFHEVRRVMRDDATLWLNLGDSYNAYNGNRGSSKGQANTRHHEIMPSLPKGSGLTVSSLKLKDLVGIPWRVALALQADGWYLRQDIIWHKPNPMPESIRDRCTKSHEYIFLLSKKPRYYYDHEAIKEPCVSLDPTHKSYRPNSAVIAEEGRKVYSAKHTMSARVYNKAGRNRRSVWTVTTKPFKGAHFAVFPSDLIEPCILAGTSEKGNCSKCGASWKRITEKTEPDEEWKRASGADSSGGYNGKAQKDYASARVQNPSEVKARILEGMRKRITVRWDPACTCDTDTKPPIVLDPFMGSGTTAVVAERFKRHWLGIELSPEYALLADRRIKDARRENKLMSRQTELFK